MKFIGNFIFSKKPFLFLFFVLTFFSSSVVFTNVNTNNIVSGREAEIVVFKIPSVRAEDKDKQGDSEDKKKTKAEKSDTIKNPTKVSTVDFLLDSMESMIGSIIMKMVSFSAMILTIVGVIFDNLLAIGLSPNFFSDTWVYVPWASIRNIANAVFILAFIYIAFMIMLNVGREWKQNLIRLIIVALLLNFSLFFSRFIIDMGNMTARVFYNSVGSRYVDSQQLPLLGGKNFFLADMFYTVKEDENGKKVYPYRTVSASFNSFVRPQQMFGVQTFKAWQASGKGDLVRFIFVAIMSITYMLMMAMVFFKAGFMFITRIVWLMYYVIISPLALVAMLVPNAQIKSYWKDWLSNIFSKSFCITIFLFLIWLALIIMINSTRLDLVPPNNNLFVLVLMFIFKAIIAWTVLDNAIKYGGKYCGDEQGKVGSVFAGVVGKAGKLAGTAALGAASWAVARPVMAGVRNKVGALGDSIVRGGVIRDAEGNIIGRKGFGAKVHEWNTSNSSFKRWAGRFVSGKGEGLMSREFMGKSYKSVMEKEEKLTQDIMKSMTPEERKKYEDNITGKNNKKIEEKVKSKKERFDGKAQAEKDLVDIEAQNKKAQVDAKDIRNSFSTDPKKEQAFLEKHDIDTFDLAKGNTINEKIDSILKEKAAMEINGNTPADIQARKDYIKDARINLSKHGFDNISNKEEFNKFVVDHGLSALQTARGDTLNEKIDNILVKKSKMLPKGADRQSFIINERKKFDAEFKKLDKKNKKKKETIDEKANQKKRKIDEKYEEKKGIIDKARDKVYEKRRHGGVMNWIRTTTTAGAADEYHMIQARDVAEAKLRAADKQKTYKQEQSKISLAAAKETMNVERALKKVISQKPIDSPTIKKMATDMRKLVSVEMAEEQREKRYRIIDKRRAKAEKKMEALENGFAKNNVSLSREIRDLLSTRMNAQANGRVKDVNRIDKELKTKTNVPIVDLVSNYKKLTGDVQEAIEDFKDYSRELASENKTIIKSNKDAELKRLDREIEQLVDKTKVLEAERFKGKAGKGTMGSANVGGGGDSE